MKKQWRTVESWGDSGRLKREEIREVIRALRDGKPLPKFAPVGTRKPESAAELVLPPSQV